MTNEIAHRFKDVAFLIKKMKEDVDNITVSYTAKKLQDDLKIMHHWYTLLYEEVDKEMDKYEHV